MPSHLPETRHPFLATPGDLACVLAAAETAQRLGTAVLAIVPRRQGLVRAARESAEHSGVQVEADLRASSIRLHFSPA